MSTPVAALAEEFSKLPRHPWRVLFWEPVAGTGERLAVGVVYEYDGKFSATRIFRDDVLDCLYGKSADGTRKLLDTGIDMYAQMAVAAQSIDNLDVPLMGLHPSELRATAARNLPELLRSAALLYSSLANLDKIDALDTEDAPLQEEVTRRFSASVRSVVIDRNPALRNCFNAEIPLGAGGLQTRFGFANAKAAMHFGVLHPIRIGQSLRDARARILELSQARDFARLDRAALIGLVPRDDDASMGDRQVQMTHLAIKEIGANAEKAGVSYLPVTTADDGAGLVLEMA